MSELLLWLSGLFAGTAFVLGILFNQKIHNRLLNQTLRSIETNVRSEAVRGVMEKLQTTELPEPSWGGARPDNSSPLGPVPPTPEEAKKRRKIPGMR